MTTAVQIGETARDRADFFRCFKAEQAKWCQKPDGSRSATPTTKPAPPV